MAEELKKQYECVGRIERGRLQQPLVLACQKCPKEVVFKRSVNIALLREELKRDQIWTQDEEDNWICPECSERKRDIAKLGQIILEIPAEKFEED
jgi:Zn finger protein HypA/HybF involved in hydrogenase expression